MWWCIEVQTCGDIRQLSHHHDSNFSSKYIYIYMMLGKLEPEFTFNTAMPPSSIQPYLGFATYFAPLCYIYKNRSSCYTVARALFCQIWCKLNVLCSDDGTILQLCKSFEYLLMHLHPRLFIHFVSLGIQPLKVRENERDHVCMYVCMYVCIICFYYLIMIIM